MATSTTTVTGRLLDALGNAVADEFVYFRLKTSGADNDVSPNEIFSVQTVEAKTDSSGDISLSIWVNGESDVDSVYRITTKNNRITPAEVIIPVSATGGTIDIADLIINYSASDSSTQQSTVLEESKAYTDAAMADPSANLSFGAPLWRTGLNVEDGADVTDTANVTAAGALMDSEVDSDIKTLTLPSNTTISTFGKSVTSSANAVAAKLALELEGFSSSGATGAIDRTVLFLGDLSASGNETTIFMDDAQEKFEISGGLDVSGNLLVSGGVRTSTTDVVTTTYTALVTDNIILVDDDTAGGDVTITLPLAATAGDGFELQIKKLGTTGNVIIDGNGSETIDGETTLTISQTNSVAKIISNGTNWYKVFPFQITGWGYYQDATYTSGSPLNSNNTKTQITIDAAGANTNTSYLPNGGHDLWAGNKITPEKVGDAYDIHLDFVALPSNQADFAEVVLDIGTVGSPNEIIKRTVTFAKTGASQFSLSLPTFALQEFLTNGGIIYFDTSVSGADIDIYNIAITVKRDFSPL